MANPLVQLKAAGGAFNTTVSTGNFGASVTAGNVIWAIGYSDNNTTFTPSTPTDTLGNTYTLLDSIPADNSTAEIYSWYTVSASSGTNSVTMAGTGSNANIDLVAFELTGFQASPLDVHTGLASNPGSGANSVSSGSVTPTVSPTQIIGFATDSALTLGAVGTSPIAFTQLANLTTYGAGTGTSAAKLEYADLASSGSPVAATWQDTGFNHHMAVVIVLKTLVQVINSVTKDDQMKMSDRFDEFLIPERRQHAVDAVIVRSIN